MRGASLPEKGQDLRRRKNGRPISLSFPLEVVIVAAAAAAVAVAAIATVTAIATVAALVVAPLVAVATAHHRRRALLMLIHLDGHVADHVLVDLRLALQLGNHRRR